jgi:hypothetical protein
MVEPEVPTTKVVENGRWEGLTQGQLRVHEQLHDSTDQTGSTAALPTNDSHSWSRAEAYVEAKKKVT